MNRSAGNHPPFGVAASERRLETAETPEPAASPVSPASLPASAAQSSALAPRANAGYDGPVPADVRALGPSLPAAPEFPFDRTAAVLQSRLCGELDRLIELAGGPAAYAPRRRRSAPVQRPAVQGSLPASPGTPSRVERRTPAPGHARVAAAGPAALRGSSPARHDALGTVRHYTWERVLAHRSRIAQRAAQYLLLEREANAPFDPQAVDSDALQRALARAIVEVLSEPSAPAGMRPVDAAHPASPVLPPAASPDPHAPPVAAELGPAHAAASEPGREAGPEPARLAPEVPPEVEKSVLHRLHRLFPEKRTGGADPHAPPATLPVIFAALAQRRTAVRGVMQDPVTLRALILQVEAMRIVAQAGHGDDDPDVWLEVALTKAVEARDRPVPDSVTNGIARVFRMAVGVEDLPDPPNHALEEAVRDLMVGHRLHCSSMGRLDIARDRFEHDVWSLLKACHVQHEDRRRLAHIAQAVLTVMDRRYERVAPEDPGHPDESPPPLEEAPQGAPPARDPSQAQAPLAAAASPAVPQRVTLAQVEDFVEAALRRLDGPWPEDEPEPSPGYQDVAGRMRGAHPGVRATLLAQDDDEAVGATLLAQVNRQTREALEQMAPAQGDQYTATQALQALASALDRFFLA